MVSANAFDFSIRGTRIAGSRSSASPPISCRTIRRGRSSIRWFICPTGGGRRPRCGCSPGAGCPRTALHLPFGANWPALTPSFPSGSGPFTLSDRLAWGYAFNGSIACALFLIFAAIALLMASLGLYAVIAHSVSQRTREIGIRVAIGATAGDVLALVFAQGMRPLAIGLAVGLAGSFALNRTLQSELVRVSPADPLALSVAALALVTSAALGCLIPARRATQVDPAIALRHE